VRATLPMNTSYKAMSKESTQSVPVWAESLKSMVAVVCRRKIPMLTVFTTIVGIVALVTFLMPRRYESHMKVFVKNERADLVVSPDARDAGQARGDVSESQVNSEIELLTSNDLLVRVVRACRLYEHSDVTMQAAGEPDPEAIERAVRKLQSTLKITAVRKANIIQIIYADSSPELAASVLKELSTAYLDAHLIVHGTAGSQQFFRNQALHYETELRDAESRLGAFRTQHQLTAIVEQRELLLRKTMDFESDVRQADATIAETGSRVHELRGQVAAQERRIVTQIRAVPNQYSVERLTTMLAELENRRSLAMLKFRTEDPLVAEIDEEISNTRAALDRASRLVSAEESTDVNPLRHALESDLARAELQEAGLNARRKSLTEALTMYRARLTQVEDASLGHDELQRQLKQAEENYVLYARKQEESRIADSLDQQKIANVAIAELPTAPHLPAAPNVLLNLGLGVVLAAFASVGAAFALDRGGASFHLPAELEAATGYPVFATVPFEG
jgi:uncharacterized protein involved in exopolysaccharide biosynthesis